MNKNLFFTLLLFTTLPTFAVFITNESPETIHLHRFGFTKNYIGNCLMSTVINPGKTLELDNIKSCQIALKEEIKGGCVFYIGKQIQLKKLSNTTHIHFFTVDKIENNDAVTVIKEIIDDHEELKDEYLRYNN